LCRLIDKKGAGEKNPSPFLLVGERGIREVVEFLRMLKVVTPQHKVTPEVMKQVGGELNLILDIHRLIDEFTGCGIISAPIQASLRSGCAQYEINPSLYWG